MDGWLYHGNTFIVLIIIYIIYDCLDAIIQNCCNFIAYRLSLHLLYINPLTVESMLFNSFPPGQNDRQFGKQQFQIHFVEWKW